MTLAAMLPAILAAFLASFVEVVEAFTVVLAVATMRGWRPALSGTGAALAVLVVIALAFSPLLHLVPIDALRFGIGVLTLLFGLRWLRKAILRAAGVIPLHDEEQVFVETEVELERQYRAHLPHLDWLAGLTVFKVVLMEGIEVIFIVIALGASDAALFYGASLGAAAACLAVVAIGAALHKPLSRVPENTLKFGVGVMLSAFGVFWTGEGLGVHWPGGDAALMGLAALFLVTALALARLAGWRRIAAT
jgi:Ca2+/H+ antiporter, TMEM165/GDT1 family